MSYYGKTLYLDFSKLPRVDKRFSLGRILARGICARICEAMDLEEGRKVAIKILNNLAENAEVIQEEYRIFKNLTRHDNFPTFYGAFLHKYDREEDDELWLVMEYCEGGSVGDLLHNMARNDRSLNEPLVGYIVREVLNALAYLHMNHIVHRDVKARNILLTSDGQVKLTDFGFSRHLKHTLSRRTTAIGSPHWMAPEVISSPFNEPPQDMVGEEDENSRGYDFHCDIWSLGITAIELADGEPPLWNVHPMRVLYQIVNNPPPELKKPANWSNSFSDFLSECLVKNPEHRPVAIELLEHPFMEEIPEDTNMLRNQLRTLLKHTATSIDLEKHYEAIVLNGKLKQDHNVPYKKMYTDDLVTLDVVDEERVLLTLGNRFSRDIYHTYIAGNILLIINPLKETNLYDEKHHERYVHKAACDEEPHIFAIIDRAWQDMVHHKEHQNVIFTGYRNSGKSFNTTQSIRHLTHMAKGNKMLANRIEQLPLILDCFGNAATEGNANSTRHARYIEFTFTESGKLSGAAISLYFLEKWRISGQLSKSNRNFHVFYYVYYGLKKDGLLDRFQLDGRTSFRFLPIGDTEGEYSYYLIGYAKLKECLRHWDMDKQEQEFIFQTIAAILLIGQIQFEGNHEAAVANPDVLNKVSYLLGINNAKLGYTLCNTSTIVHGDSEITQNSIEQSEAARDALARGLYSRLVDWLVNALNINLLLGRKVFGEKHTMGFFDPPGYDPTARKYSFNHMIFNIVNEQLAYHYNQNVFINEMQDYQEEDVDMPEFDFNDNREAINLMLAKPDGILAIIEEQTRTGAAEIEDLAEIIAQRVSSNCFEMVDQETFAVRHFASTVRYKSWRIIKENRDFLSADFIHLLRHSTSSRMANIFSNKMTKTGHVTSNPPPNPVPDKYLPTKLVNKHKGINTVSQGQYSQTRQMQTIAMRTRQSLIHLMQNLAKGSSYYVRCLRRSTSTTATPGLDKDYLADQIRAFGVLETIRIRQRGYTNRIPFAEFLRRYQFLAFDFDEQVDITSENCRLLLLRLKLEGWMVSHTKVLLKHYTESFLARMYEEQVRKIVKVQAIIRSVLMKLKKKRGIDITQHNARRYSRSDMTKDEAALAIQKSYRGYSVRKEYGIGPGKEKRFNCKTIEEEAANTIQYFWRKWKGKSLYQQLLLYRADKTQKLNYFCQQVHLYNQETCGYMRKHGSAIAKYEINPAPPNSHLKMNELGVNKKLQKLPLFSKNRHYMDTTFMCVASFKGLLHKNDRSTQDRNESAYRSPTSPSNRPRLTITSARDGTDRVCRTPGLPHRYHGKTSPDGKASSVAKNRAITPPKSLSINKPFYEGDPSYGSNKVNVQGWNDRTHQTRSPTYGLARPVGPGNNKAITPTYTSYASPSDQGKIAKEIEQRAAGVGKSNSDDDDNAPFNFRAMLKKTDYSQKLEDGSNGGFSSHRNSSLPPVVYQTNAGTVPRKYQAPSPNKHLIAPGLVIEGEEADL